MPDKSTSWSRRDRIQLLSLFVLGLVVRSVVVFVMPAGLRHDTDAYREFAQTLAATGTLGQPANDSQGSQRAIASAHRPPLYPIALAAIARQGFVSAPRIAALHVALGVATVLLTALLARRWTSGASWLAAGVIVACDPILCFQSAQIMTETLATFLSAAALYFLTDMQGPRPRRSAALGGGVLGLAVLCRPVFLVWLVLIAVALPLVDKRLGRWRWAKCLALVTAALVVLMPWTFRNAKQLGWPVLTTTHGGYTMLLGNNQDYYAYLRRGDFRHVWDAQRFQRGWSKMADRANTSAVQLDRLAYQEAFRNMASDPTMCAVAVAFRISRLWGVMPRQTHLSETKWMRVVRYGVASWYVVLLILVVIGVVALGHDLWKPPWLWGALLCLACTSVHAFYWCDLRMRAPLTPVLGLLALRGAAVLARQAACRKLLFFNRLRP